MKNDIRKILTGRCARLFFALTIAGVVSCAGGTPQQGGITEFNVPEEYLLEAENIPDFWLATVDDVNGFIKNNVRKGKYKIAGRSAGGRPIYAVYYGNPRKGTGTTTYSGSLSVNDIAAFRGQDNDKTVYMGIAGVHGFELEGIMGMLNLISVLETGSDLDGEQWPEIVDMCDSLDRIILLPLVNPDGRARVPIRMESHKGHAPDAYLVHEYLNTGGREGGKLIGWPQVKEYIPMDFAMFEFPGGYPNDNGVNIMHDDFFGTVQPETQILLDIASREKPDLIMNMHTGVHRDNYFMGVLRPDCEPDLIPVWEGVYRAINTALTQEGLKKTSNAEAEANPKLISTGKIGFNLNTALNYHCGALCVTVEEASHGYSGIYDNGDPVEATPQKLLRSELTAHQEAMKFLYRTGGRARWDKVF